MAGVRARVRGAAHGQAADIVLMRRDLTDVLAAMHLSKAVYGRILLNFVWAFGFNAVGIPIAAGVAYPAGILLPPWAAGLAMALSSVSVVTSSLLLNRWRRPAAITPDGLAKLLRRRAEAEDPRDSEDPMFPMLGVRARAPHGAPAASQGSDWVPRPHRPARNPNVRAALHPPCTLVLPLSS